MSDHHENPIKTPKQLITVIVLAFLVPIALIMLLAGWVSDGDKSATGSQAMSDKAIAERLAPIAVTEYEAGGGASAKTGEQIYKAICAGCHDSGAAGAPKLGDKGAWASRLAMGLEKLSASAIKGKNAMPARGGSPDLTDADMLNAVAYLGNASGAKFKEMSAAPVASTAAPAASVSSATAVDGGKKLYDATCAACHNSGAAAAPKFGDKAAWAPRLKAGVDALTASAIKGKNAMPPKGGASASDAEIKQAVQYLINSTK